MSSDCPRCKGYMSETDWAYGSCPHCGWEVEKPREKANRLYDRYFSGRDEGAYDADTEPAW